MQTPALCKPLAHLIAVGLLGLSAAAWAAPTTYTEVNTGDLPGSAEDTAAAAQFGLTILGNLTDGRGGNAPNLVDMFKFSVGLAGNYFFNTFGSAIADTQLFLFDSAGNGIHWNQDAAPGNTLSAFSTLLGIGDYYIAVSFQGMDPDDGAGSIFDTLGNGGAAQAGSGAISSWTDFNGSTIWDVSAYTINAYVPEPGALALSLAALGLMAGFSRRRA
jgi:hypothetical protein